MPSALADGNKAEINPALAPMLSVVSDTGIGSANNAFSIITFSEIVYGTKKSNIAVIQSYFSGLNIIHINTEISKIFKGITLSYSYNHHIKIPDALIAATAVCTGMQLYTLNKRDFDFIPEINFYRP
jgi:predicted nucleic acid-binding protein